MRGEASWLTPLGLGHALSALLVLRGADPQGLQHPVSVSSAETVFLQGEDPGRSEVGESGRSASGLSSSRCPFPRLFCACSSGHTASTPGTAALAGLTPPHHSCQRWVPSHWLVDTLPPFWDYIPSERGPCLPQALP